ncbi:hypothetical protein [Sediminibacter sp. Hel_I_10]|uniref:hypothetical protein n=1 Tax=Sediminibacter sp. Hel_I_10 TaxID=1392490 RepID=UPI00068D20CF|nr:hypothetical protein [Sediminibacter sp. Hel_I_10]
MKTLRLTVFLILVLILAPTSAQSQDQESFILNVTEFTIKFGHDTDFTDGVKKWNKCYKENNGTKTWNVWHRLQGKGNVYVMAGRMNNWAEMDEKNPAAAACRAIALESITPHIESSEFNTTRSMPDISLKTDLAETNVIWTTSFIVNDDVAFNEVVKEVTTTMMSKDKTRGGYWYRVMGGEGTDYFVSSPYKNFADMDVDRDGVWKMYESVHGKSKTETARKKLRDSCDRIWDYVYTLESDLSYTN